MLMFYLMEIGKIQTRGVLVKSFTRKVIFGIDLTSIWIKNHKMCDKMEQKR